MYRRVSILNEHVVLLYVLLMAIYFNRQCADYEVNLSSIYEPPVLERRVEFLKNLVHNAFSLCGMSFKYSHYSTSTPGE